MWDEDTRVALLLYSSKQATPVHMYMRGWLYKYINQKGLFEGALQLMVEGNICTFQTQRRTNWQVLILFPFEATLYRDNVLPEKGQPLLKNCNGWILSPTLPGALAYGAVFVAISTSAAREKCYSLSISAAHKQDAPISKWSYKGMDASLHCHFIAFVLFVFFSFSAPGIGVKLLWW